MGLFEGAKEGLKNLIARKPTPQEQQVNTGGVMEPFAPLTSQVPPAPAEAQPTSTPTPEPTLAAVYPINPM